MFCPNCGKEMKDDDLFCGECGWKKGSKVEENGNSPSMLKINISPKVLVSAVVVVAVVIIAFNLFGKKYKNEWVEKNGARYYYDENGRKVTNKSIEVDGVYYDFDNNGNAYAAVSPSVKKEIDSTYNYLSKKYDETMKLVNEMKSTGRQYDIAGPTAAKLAGLLNDFKSKRAEFNKMNKSSFSSADLEYYNNKKSTIDMWSRELFN